jgi:hypothetical protein
MSDCKHAASAMIMKLHRMQKLQIRVKTNDAADLHANEGIV